MLNISVQFKEKKYDQQITMKESILNYCYRKKYLRSFKILLEKGGLN